MREDAKRSASLARRLRATLTEAELIVWSQLNKRVQGSARFRRQHPVGPYVADFACLAARLVVELEGGTHGSDHAVAHDAKRTNYLARRGWLVIRFTNDDVYSMLGAVLDAIWNAVDGRLGVFAPPSVALGAAEDDVSPRKWGEQRQLRR